MTDGMKTERMKDGTGTRTERGADPMKLTFFHALFLIFLTLKLTGVIDWSWGWVFAPLWVIFLVELLYGLVKGQ
jgi:hypothetical protein